MAMVMATFRTALRPIVDFALPPRCPGCGTITAEDHVFCMACWQSLHFLGDPCCARCGLPFEYDAGGDAQCGACLSDPPSFDRLRAAVAYGDVARHVALRLKYGGRPGVARTLAHFMARHLPADDADVILTPVPLYRWRIWARGYNQSALIASALAERIGAKARLDLLRRVKATPPLRNMSRRERALAVKGAFAVTEAHRTEVEGRRIVLVDDVYTSGATTNGCAAVLKRSGAASVHILCWARVVAATEN